MEKKSRIGIDVEKLREIVSDMRECVSLTYPGDIISEDEVIGWCDRIDEVLDGADCNETDNVI